MKMKHLAVAALMSIMAGSALAAPSVAKVGTCTSFLNGNVSSNSTCSVDIKHTPQTKTTTLKTATDSHTITTNIGSKNSGKAAYSLDGLIAEHFFRDANTYKRISLNQAESDNADVLTCYESNKDNICHS